MKLSKLMLTMAVAASAFAACNKEDVTPVSKNLKSVDISLENVLFTKSVDATEIANGSDVVINDFMVYFTDGSTIYTPMKANGTDNSKVYFSTKEEAGLPEAYSEALQFHFLPAAVNQVVVLGNLGDQKNYPTTVEGFRKALEVADENNKADASNLTLYGKSALVPKSPDHNVNPPKHATDVYKADITLTPRIARVEVVNFIRSANGQLFDRVTIDQVVFDNYYPSYSDLTAEYAQNGTVVACPLTQTDIYNHFATATGWMSDELELEFASKTAETEEANLAYHFFPDKTATATEAEGVVTTTGAYPRLLVKATGYYTGDSNPTPLYLYTKAFRTTAKTPELISDEDFATAAIFEVEFTFSDENFLQQEKCVEVSVTPKKWNVIAVNPVL